MVHDKSTVGLEFQSLVSVSLSRPDNIDIIYRLTKITVKKLTVGMNISVCFLHAVMFFA